MRDLNYSISAEVFRQFPEYIRGVVVAHQVHNQSSPPELVELLRESGTNLRQRFTLEQFLADPKIAVWREAFRAMGVKPSEYRPSIEALGRRVLRGQELPSINALVDIGNLVSLNFIAPTGGHAIDHLTQDIALRPATGQETFIPFGDSGGEGAENPAPGELVFVEGEVVLTRRWIWRQSNHTLTLPSTTAIEFNVDALPPFTRAEVEEICQAVMRLVERFCGGHMWYALLTKDSPVMALSHPPER